MLVDKPEREPAIVSKYIHSGRAQLRCDIAGAGPPLVFLHAGVADRRSWSAIMSELADTHRSVAYDRRGFGETTCEPEPFAHVDDLLAVVNALGTERVSLVGNSQGGRIAIDFALAYPERVRAMVLVAPALSGEPEPTSLPDAIARLDAAIEAASAAGDVDRVNHLEAHVWLDGPQSPEGRVGGAARALFLDMNHRALTAHSPGDERPPPSAIDRLGELAMPIHVIVGELDLELMHSLSRRIAERVQHGTHITLEGCAHLPQLEQPQTFLDELRMFLC